MTDVQGDVTPHPWATEGLTLETVDSRPEPLGTAAEGRAACVGAGQERTHPAGGSLWKCFN